MVKSGGGVLFISSAQLIVGLCLLGINQGYKKYYYNSAIKEEDVGGVSENIRIMGYESPLDWRSPMGFIFLLSMMNNIFAICGLFGVLNAQRELIIAFFVYNAAQMVVSFHYFVDLCTDASVTYKNMPMKLTSFEQAAAAFVFFSFLLSCGATFFAVKAVDEIKAKQREEYNRITVLSDTLQYEPDTV